jgi:hypothetical protein
MVGKNEEDVDCGTWILFVYVRHLEHLILHSPSKGIDIVIFPIVGLNVVSVYEFPKVRPRSG